MKKDRPKFARMCVSCRKLKQKQDLIRLVKSDELGLIIDETYKMQKRGVYVCRDVKCIELLKKSNRLAKQFGLNISQDFYEKLKDFLEKENAE